MKILTLRQKHSSLCSFMVVLAMGAASAKADLIDVNFYSSFYGGSTASGAAVVGTSLDTWNGINADPGSGGPINLSDVGGNPTSVTLSYNSPNGSGVVSGTANIQPNPSLMSDYLFNNDGSFIAVGLAGLAPNTAYDLYIYLASNDAMNSDRAADLTANSVSGMATGNPETSFINGQNYLLLVATSSALGTINILETDDALNTSGEVDMNGLQIGSVPDSSATLPLLALSAFGLVLFARRMYPVNLAARFS